MKHNIKLYSLCVFFAIGLAACGSDDEVAPQPQPDRDGVSVKVMTYNIYSGQKKGLNAIADVINQADPDIIGMQEVESQSNKIKEDVVATLTARTQLKYAYYAETPGAVSTGKYGNLILSKYPLKNEVTHSLGVIITVGSYPRSLGIVELEKEGKSFYFAVTHLDHLSDITNKMHQVEQILLHTKDLDKPVILSGDFNAIEGSDPLNLLLQRFTLGCLNNNPGLTTGTPIPTKAIDFLMYAPAGAVAPVAYDVFYDAFSESDHFPVVATFNIYVN